MLEQECQAREKFQEMRPNRVRIMARCELCGKVAETTDGGASLCSDCRARWHVLYCGRCGVRSQWSADHSHLPDAASYVCSFCLMSDRLNALDDADRDAIRDALAQGMLVAIKEMRARFGWSIHEGNIAVALLTNGSGPRITHNPPR
jgi:hypothetical protein